MRVLRKGSAHARALLGEGRLASVKFCGNCGEMQRRAAWRPTTVRRRGHCGVAEQTTWKAEWELPVLSLCQCAVEEKGPLELAVVCRLLLWAVAKAYAEERAEPFL
ncbi:hypothetical protein TraAM80_10012, partial [Trypanosoma rangeli]